MEAELRAIVTDAVGTASPEQVNLAEAIRRRFAPFGGVDDLEIHPREPVREPPRLIVPSEVAGDLPPLRTVVELRLN